MEGLGTRSFTHLALTAKGAVARKAETYRSPEGVKTAGVVAAKAMQMRARLSMARERAKVAARVAVKAVVEKAMKVARVEVVPMRVGLMVVRVRAKVRVTQRVMAETILRSQELVVVSMAKMTVRAKVKERAKMQVAIMVTAMVELMAGLKVKTVVKPKAIR